MTMGDTATHIHIILKGECLLTHKTPISYETIRIGSGSCFGEEKVFDNLPSYYNISAASDSV
jgi:CRP-like cAMP-binding protein